MRQHPVVAGSNAGAGRQPPQSSTTLRPGELLRLLATLLETALPGPQRALLALLKFVAGWLAEKETHLGPQAFPASISASKALPPVAGHQEVASGVSGLQETHVRCGWLLARR
jgi:hypothetical protein